MTYTCEVTDISVRQVCEAMSRLNGNWHIKATPTQVFIEEGV